MTRNFPGFTMPRGSYFPPEMRELLPDIDTLSELKVLFCILDLYFQAGLDAVLMTYDDIQYITGLSRYGTSEGIERGVLRGTLKKTLSLNGFKYEPHLRPNQGLKIKISESEIQTPATPKDSGESEIQTPPNRMKGAERSFGEIAISQNMHVNMSYTSSFSSTFFKNMHALRESEIQTPTEREVRQKLLQILVEEFGLSTRVADDIAFHRDPDYLLMHVLYARYAVDRGFIKKSLPGWIVASIRDNWTEPLGFDLIVTLQEAGWTDQEIFELHHTGQLDIPELENRAGYVLWLKNQED